MKRLTLFLAAVAIAACRDATAPVKLGPGCWITKRAPLDSGGVHYADVVVRAHYALCPIAALDWDEMTPR